MRFAPAAPASLAALVLVALPALADAPLPAAANGADYPTVDMGQVALGQLLCWDRVISGNRNISCATCHYPRFGTSDGQPLAFG